MIEFFAVTPDEDQAFLAAWDASAPPGATLHRALRADVQWRFVAVPGEPRDGVLLVAAFDVPPGEEFRAGWEPVREAFSGRQGFVGSQVLEDAGGHAVALVHWSSPLMYARAVSALGDLIAALPSAAHAALYVPQPMSSVRRSGLTEQ